MIDSIERVMDRVERLPEWVRPVCYGPLLVLLWMGLKGALVLVPIAVLIVLFSSSDPGSELASGALVVGVALAASAAGGLAYSFLGRPLRRVPVLGRFLAGTVIVFPYLVPMWYVIRHLEGEPFVLLLAPVEWLLITGLSILFGFVLGASLFDA